MKTLFVILITYFQIFRIQTITICLELFNREK